MCGKVQVEKHCGECGKQFISFNKHFISVLLHNMCVDNYTYSGKS